MKPIETKKDYQDYVDKKSPNSPIIKNCFNAFWVGGLICSIGQIIFNYCKFRGMDVQMCNTIVSVILIGISAFLTGLNLQELALLYLLQVLQILLYPLLWNTSLKVMLWELEVKCLLLQVLF